jgi:hypothetical protein
LFDTARNTQSMNVHARVLQAAKRRPRH